MNSSNGPLKKVTLQEGLALAASDLSHIGNEDYLIALSKQSEKVIQQQIPDIRGVLRVVLAQVHGAVLQ